MIKDAYVIRLEDDVSSDKLADNLINSSSIVGNDFDINKFDAITPERVAAMMTLHNIRWNYPWDKVEVDFQSGLKKSPYQTRDPNRRIACFLSHYILWKMCAKRSEGMFIFEHDALFTRKIDVQGLSDAPYDIISLNDPRGATRKSGLFHEKVQEQNARVVAIPNVDTLDVPQGLPGNSAYFIKPEGAKKLLKLVAEFGAWPNDAIMCKQLMPRQLGTLREYCTVIQPSISTTTQ